MRTNADVRPDASNLRARRSRAALGALLLAGCTLGGCATAGPGVRAGAPAAPESVCPVEPTVLVEPRARLLVTPRDGAYLVLGAGRLAAAGRVRFGITYAAAPALAAAEAPDAPARLAAGAGVLFSAFRLLAEATGAEAVDVTAVFGAPGERGLAAQIAFLRGEDGWRPTPAVRGAVARVPLLPPRVDRTPEREEEAREVAARFLEVVDRSDYAAAWELSSAVVKATMSRATFERQLEGFHKAAGAARQEVYRTFDASPGEPLPGAQLDVAFGRALPGGASMAAVRLRLDDDQVWRVAGVEEIAPAAAAKASTSIPTEASGTTSTRAPTSLVNPSVFAG